MRWPWADPGGVAHFLQDIYDRDNAVAMVEDKADPQFKPPVAITP